MSLKPSVPLHSAAALQARLLQELVQFARKNSAFYRDLYESVPDDASTLEQLPAINHTSFWQSNIANVAANRVLTGPLLDGGIFKTGGTTSEPKVTFYSRDELHSVTVGMADCFIRAGLQPGDRVANLFNNGELYMMYFLTILCWIESSTPYIQLPISGVLDVERMVWPLRDFKVTVVASVPTNLIRVSEYLASRNEQLPDVHLIVYAGEGLYEDSKALLAKGFPNAIVRPMLYGSVDGGLIGFPTHDEDLEAQSGGPVYIPNSPTVTVELLRDDGTVITEPGEKGLIHVTNLTRRLMPIIRYPTGDAAEWVDASKKLFVLRGRDVVGLKIGPATYDFRHLRGIAIKTLGEGIISGFQIVARRKNTKDELVFRIVSTIEDTERGYTALENAMRTETPRYVPCLEKGLINLLAVEWVSWDDLYTNSRTGKLRETVDQRLD